MKNQQDAISVSFGPREDNDDPTQQKNLHPQVFFFHSVQLQGKHSFSFWKFFIILVAKFVTNASNAKIFI